MGVTINGQDWTCKSATASWQVTVSHPSGANDQREFSVLIPCNHPGCLADPNIFNDCLLSRKAGEGFKDI